METNKNKDINLLEKSIREKEVQDRNNTDSGKSLVAFCCAFLFRNSHITTGADSQTEILRAAGIGIAKDDPTEPVLTLRMWVLGIAFCVVVSGLNTLYTLRTPSLTISGSVVLLLAYPLGKLWEKVIPNWTIPLGRLAFNLNPGPFNTKASFLAKATVFSLIKIPPGACFDLYNVQPQYLRSSRRRCPDRAANVLRLQGRMGIPNSHYFFHIPHRVLSCWTIPGDCGRSPRADLAWSSGCYCVDHNPPPCQPGTSAGAVSSLDLLSRRNGTDGW